MAIVTIAAFPFPSPLLAAVGESLGLTTTTLNASGDRIGYVIPVPKAGTLDWFEWRTGTVGNNPDNGMRTSFQTIDPATGFPDTTQDQFVDTTGTFSSNVWQVPSGVMTDDGTPGGVKRTVVAGEMLGCVIDFVGFVAGDSLGVARFTLSGKIDNLYTADGSSGAYAKSTLMPLLALKYADGTYAEFPLNVSPVSSAGFLGTPFNSGSTPDERALRFQVPVSMRVRGCWLWVDIDAAADVILYDNADNVLTSISLDPDQRGGTSANLVYVTFPAQVTLSASTVYRLALLPTTVTNVNLFAGDVNTAALMAAVAGGEELYLSTRTDAGAWTDTDTTRPLMGLILDGIDDGGGGGGGGETSHVSFG